MGPGDGVPDVPIVVEGGGEEVPPTPPPDAPPEIVPEGGMLFASLHPETRSIRVECGAGGSGKGKESAHVAAETADSCVVTVILNNRERLTATVSGVTEGRYTCFEGDSDGCARE